MTHPLLDVPCACASVRRLARVLTRIYDDALRPTGLVFTQFGLLKTLEANPDLSQTQLSVGLAFDSTTLTRTLSVILKRGWIERNRGRDRRQWIYRLTPAGRDRIEDADPRWEAAHAALERVVGGGTADRLTDMSNELVAVLHQRSVRERPVSTGSAQPRKPRSSKRRQTTAEIDASA